MLASHARLKPGGGGSPAASACRTPANVRAELWASTCHNRDGLPPGFGAVCVARCSTHSTAPSPGRRTLRILHSPVAGPPRRRGIAEAGFGGKDQEGGMRPWALTQRPEGPPPSCVGLGPSARWEQTMCKARKCLYEFTPAGGCAEGCSAKQATDEEQTRGTPKAWPKLRSALAIALTGKVRNPECRLLHRPSSRRHGA